MKNIKTKSLDALTEEEREAMKKAAIRNLTTFIVIKVGIFVFIAVASAYFFNKYDDSDTTVSDVINTVTPD